MRKHIVILVLAVFFVFGGSLSHDFVLFDDNVHLYENPHLNPPTLNGAAELWKKPYFGMYIPMTYSVWALLSIGASNPGPNGKPIMSATAFHVANLVVHAVNTVLIFLILMELGFVGAPALLGALLFSLHPLQVETVAWVSGMKDLLYSAFLLSAALLVLRCKRGEVKTYLAATGFFVLALLSKPTAVIAPSLIGVLVFVWRRETFRAFLPWMASWCALSLPAIWMTKHLQPDLPSAFIAPVLLRHLVAGDALAFYLSKIVFPFPLTLDYGRDAETLLSAGQGYLTWVVPVLILTFLIAWKNRYAWTVAGVLLLCVLPVLGFLPFRFQQFSSVGDRYLYLALFAVALGAAKLMEARPKRVVMWSASVLVAGFAVMSSSQVSVWKDSPTLFTHMLKVNPRSLIAENNYANFLEQKGDLENALYHYRRGLAVKPDWLDASYNVAAILTKMGRYQEAVPYLQDVLVRSPTHADARFVMGVIHYDTGDVKTGRALIEESIQLSPRSARFHAKLGIIAMTAGESAIAEREFMTALEIDPSASEVLNNFGVLKLRQGDTSQAYQFFKQALFYRPNYREAANNLAVIQQRERISGQDG